MPIQKYSFYLFSLEVFKLLASVISFFFPLQVARQVATALSVMPPAAIAPLGCSRMTVRINHLRSPILSLRGLQIVQGPLDREWKLKTTYLKEKVNMKTNNQGNTLQNVQGLTVNPKVYLSRDGKYLIHSFLGIRISKHVNYCKRILNVETDSTVEKKAI